MQSQKQFAFNGWLIAAVMIASVAVLGNAYASKAITTQPAEEQIIIYEEEMMMEEEEEALWCKIIKGIVCYVPNRALDLVDVVRLNGSFGPAGAVNVRATNYATAGISHYDNVLRVGLIGKRLNQLAIWEEINNELGTRFLWWECGCVERPEWEVGVDAHLGVGVRAAVNLDDLCDFLLGFFFYDRHGDDCGPAWGEDPRYEGRYDCVKKRIIQCDAADGKKISEPPCWE